MRLTAVFVPLSKKASKTTRYGITAFTGALLRCIIRVHCPKLVKLDMNQGDERDFATGLFRLSQVSTAYDNRVDR